MILGFAALFSEYIYILVPIYETDQCKCKFDLNKDDCFVTDSNVSLFFVVNWLQTVILIYLLYAIRNVKDELNLKTELIYVIIIWVIFSLSYFTTLVASNINKADDGHESAKAIFSFIQIRNFFSFFVQTLYCYFTIKSSPGIRSNQDYMSTLHDFEVAILGTVLPYLYFKKYVCED